MIFPWLPEQHICAVAQSLLHRAFGAGRDSSAPVDLDALVYDYLCEHDRLSFDDDAELGAEAGEIVLGKTLPLRGKILLARCLKSDCEPGRGRFTLAHEIGHWMLHRPIFLAKAEELSLFANDEPEFEFVGLNKSIFPDGSHRKVQREEWQANQFAIALLVNSDFLRSEFVARFGEPPVAWLSAAWHIRTSNLREHARLLAACRASGRPPLRETFGLSTEAMAIVLESRGYAVERPPLM